MNNAIQIYGLCIIKLNTPICQGIIIVQDKTEICSVPDSTSRMSLILKQSVHIRYLTSSCEFANSLQDIAMQPPDKQCIELLPISAGSLYFGIIWPSCDVVTDKVQTPHKVHTVINKVHIVSLCCQIASC